MIMEDLLEKIKSMRGNLSENERILQHFGKAAVIAKAGEEAAELSAAIGKYNVAMLRNTPPDKGEFESIENMIIDEIADVYETLSRLILIFDLEKIISVKNRKREKVLAIIGKG